MNRTSLILTAVLVVSQHLVAQQDTVRTVETSTTAPKEETVTISEEYYSSLRDYRAKYLELKPKYDRLDSIHGKSMVELGRLRRQSTRDESDIQNLKKELEATNIWLVNVASNFLYIPYEAYSVELIALPAFEAVTDRMLREKHNVRYDLLKNYKKHVEELRDFLVNLERELKFAGKYEAMGALTKMKQSSFYSAYQRLGEVMKDVYIGKKVLEVERQLEVFDGNTHGLNVKDIIDELNACLKTQEGL